MFKKNLLGFSFYFVCCILPAFMYVHRVCLVPKVARGGHRIPWNGVRDGCERPCGCCTSTLGLQGQRVLLTPEPFSPAGELGVI